MSWTVVTAADLGPHESVVTNLSQAPGIRIRRLPPGITGWTPELIADYAPSADAYVGTFRGIGLPGSVIAASPRLKVIASPIIGTEHIDTAAATDCGVLVAHGAMAENFDGMAEAGVLLIAALRKQLLEKRAKFNAGEWKKAPAGHMVGGSTIGLLGFGRIGQGIAARLANWDARLIAADPYVSRDVATSLGVELVPFETLLAASDTLLVLVTLTPETRGIIGAPQIAAMKPGSSLINIGRGGCVDERAVADALDSGHLAGAAIDTWEEEPPQPDHPLRNHSRVIGTSHDVGHSAELYAAIPRVACENVLRALRGELPLHVRNPEAVPAWRARVDRMETVA